MNSKIHQGTISNRIDKEAKAGRISGPFVQQPFEDLFISSVSVVPEKVAGTCLG